MKHPHEIAITHQSKHKSFNMTEKIKCDQVRQEQIDHYKDKSTGAKEIKTKEIKPVAWRVTNTAGVWIYFSSKIHAESFHKTYFDCKTQLQELFLYPF